MNRYKLLIIALFGLLPFSCMDMDVEPVNIITDTDVFTNVNGINAYMAKMYYLLPVEDFRYSHALGWNQHRVITNVAGVTGEACGRDTPMQAAWNWFPEGYELIRAINVFLETLPEYAGYHEEENLKHWIGEAHMIRAFAYTTLAKRYGGVPIVTNVINDPDLAELPRNSEEDVWDLIEKDYQYAIENMKGESPEGRFNKYAAAAYKSQAMLFAASVANFSDIELQDTNNGNTLVCGIPKQKAVEYYTSAYEAAKLVEEGGYQLYMGDWQEGNLNAQYENYHNIHHKTPNVETIFIKEFRYPELKHSWDVIYGPLQLTNGGLSGGLTPTWNLVSLFDGIKPFVDENNKYILYNSTMEPFEEAEPRLRATVIFPGDIYKETVIEVYKGIYISEYPEDGLAKMYVETDRSSLYQNNPNLLVSVSDTDQRYYQLPNGEMMRASGLSGAFNSQNRGTRTGFLFRKLLDPKIPHAEVVNERSESDWVDMRYAEVLLARAEAAVELHNLGKSDKDYIGDAYDIIQAIRKRAGAYALTSRDEVDRDVVRRERKKELAFEHKAYWDLIRWRIYEETFPDVSPRPRLKGALPFYVPGKDKWFFDVKGAEIGTAERVFPKRWYYLSIPAAEINKNPKLCQNPGY